MIPVTCDCGRSIGVKDEHAGRRIRCPQCRATLDVPIPELAGLVATDEGAATTPDASPDPARPATARRAFLAGRAGPPIRWARVILLLAAWGCGFSLVFGPQDTLTRDRDHGNMIALYRARGDVEALRDETFARDRDYEDGRSRAQTTAICLVVALAGLAASAGRARAGA